MGPPCQMPAASRLNETDTRRTAARNEPHEESMPEARGRDQITSPVMSGPRTIVQILSVEVADDSCSMNLSGDSRHVTLKPPRGGTVEPGHAIGRSWSLRGRGTAPTRNESRPSGPSCSTMLSTKFMPWRSSAWQSAAPSGWQRGDHPGKMACSQGQEEQSCHQRRPGTSAPRPRPLNNLGNALRRMQRFDQVITAHRHGGRVDRRHHQRQ